jgi:hypothetical protein
MEDPMADGAMFWEYGLFCGFLLFVYNIVMERSSISTV